MSAGDERADVIVIGAGIAGASVAAELAGACRVVLLEREAQPGYHTTGRSAALYSPTYGPAPIRALTRASAGFFDAPPPGFAAAPLLRPRKVLTVASAERVDALAASFRELSARADVEMLSGEAARAMMPLLRPEHSAAAMMENDGADIDVHALHHGYLRRMKEKGGRLVAPAGVRALARERDGWRVETQGGVWRAPVVVNAAGAWADEVAALAGVAEIGLTPKRRTAMMIDGPGGRVDDGWPMVVDVDEAFYLKPDAGRLLVSPADETPSPPCDAQPEEIDVAICIDRIEHAFEIEVKRVLNKWAGLRSFVADKAPVVGFAPGAGGFFWLAGQGGYGIQSAPAVSRLAAALVLGRPVPDDIAAEGLDLASVSPARAGLSPENPR
ncbi:MAG: FAD-binding oxidoreductase [Aquamicrobium sp.]|uniref:NAD(P)/FAD-dependent oxidoreductase n=1 Tax=Aquamicrobium sp. TaxID=1872579 RepID=UPI00349EE2FD|nr:FAD-binding oxidoreductase [Aquamicrobium sp.]